MGCHTLEGSSPPTLGVPRTVLPTLQLGASHRRSIKGIPRRHGVHPPHRRGGFLVVTAFDELILSLPHVHGLAMSALGSDG